MEIEGVMTEDDISLFVNIHKDMIEDNRVLFYPLNTNSTPSNKNIEDFATLLSYNLDVVRTKENKDIIKKNLKKIRAKLLNIEKEKNIKKLENIDLVGRCFSPIIPANIASYYIFPFENNRLVKITRQSKTHIWLLLDNYRKQKLNDELIREEDILWSKKECIANIDKFVKYCYNNEKKIVKTNLN